MLGLTSERSLAAATKSRTQLGRDLSIIERAREATIETLAGGGRTSRADLLETWEEAGLQTVKQHGYLPIRREDRDRDRRAAT